MRGQQLALLKAEEMQIRSVKDVVETALRGFELRQRERAARRKRRQARYGKAAGVRANG